MPCIGRDTVAPCLGCVWFFLALALALPLALEVSLAQADRFLLETSYVRSTSATQEGDSLSVDPGGAFSTECQPAARHFD